MALTKVSRGLLSTSISDNGTGTVITIASDGSVTFSGSITTSDDITVDQIITTNNANGTNVRIGDDAWIGDCNSANQLRIQGTNDATKGYISFGSTSNTALGRSGNGDLTWGGGKVWHEGNDGNGSGLDADKLQGNLPSYFTNYTDTAIANLVDSSPSTLDTLNELASALGDDANFSTTVTNSIATKWTQDNTKISNWDTAYSWGDHASAGYLTSHQDISGKLDSSAYTAADVLTKIKTVDGSGSGLDADLFQGYGQTASGNRWGVMAPVGTDGVMEIGRYIDFHETDGDTGDNAIRLDATSNRLRLTTSNGYVDIGPQNTTYSHFQTDRDKFYFNKAITVDTGVITSYNEDLDLRRSNSTNHHLKLDIVSNVQRILVKTNSYGAGFQTRSFYNTTMFAPSQTGDGIVNGFAWTTSYNSLYPARSGNTELRRDNVADLGMSNARWDDVYATNGTIQTSDEREKQDIETLNEAEQRVAVAAKGLLRKFRWKDKVAAKGDDARIHFGIIAQDLEAAFIAEGLDPSRYAMFIKTEWWVGDKVYPAIAEETDEEGNVTVEGREESTDPEHHYDNQADAPADAVYHYRMGVRYSELLAFIISAI